MEVQSLELELQSIGDVVNSQTIELKARLKKLTASKAMNELLGRLEIKGEPVWGLSAKERDLVRAARRKYNS